jgi:hypothetical protein
MQQAATAEVRLDKHKVASFGPAGPSILPFWLSTESGFVVCPACASFRGRGVFSLREIAGTNLVSRWQT